MRLIRSRILLPSIVLLALFVTGLVVWKTFWPAPQRAQAGSGDLEDELSWAGEAESYYRNRAKPVPDNRGPEVLDGFRGDVHPLLNAQTRLDLTAHWTPIGQGRTYHRVLPKDVYGWFTSLSPDRVQQTYTAADFSGFLPASVGEVGQRWALDGRKVVKFLKQFHPHVSLHQASPGRLPGPEGAYGILRAVSPTHLEIAFRVHCEFYVTPEVRPLGVRALAWYTPSYLAGNMLVNKQTGTVEYFRLGLPTDKGLNVYLSLVVNQNREGLLAPEVVPVERMELVGGNSPRTEKMEWTAALSPVEALHRLAKVFYKFEEIDWTPFDRAVAQARQQKRPICAVVSWGSIDDQSC